MFHTWAKLRKKGKAFGEYATGILESIEVLKLAWVKVLPFSEGTFGGWISENMLGLARITPWLYSRIDCVANDPEFVEPPHPIEKWVKTDMSKWLIARGVDSTGLKIDLYNRIKELMNRPEGPPPLLAQGGGSVHSLLDTCDSLWHLMFDGDEKRIQE